MRPYKTYSDEQLAQLLKSSDARAFSELYNRYWDKLYMVAGNKLEDYHLAQEIVQDIFLDIWQRRLGANLTDNIAAYLAAALKYKIINARLKRSRQKQYADDARKDGSIPYYSLEQELSFEELRERLTKLVAGLPEKCRMVYKLSREEGYTHKEIAEELQIKEKTVESHLTRALKILRANINSFFTFFLF